MNDCIFCKIAGGTIPSDRVYEDEQLVVFKDIYPKAPVHLLMVPRQHVESLNDLTSAHDGLMAHMLRTLPEVALRAGLTDGYRTIINTGRGGGQEVPHLHLHILGGGRLPGF
jgi:histidine triad (HIT) family protein